MKGFRRGEARKAFAICAQCAGISSNSDGAAAFKRYLRQRLLCSEGRFFRLFLKTARPDNKGIPLAPAESLAFRTEVKGKDWKFLGPPLGQLCRDFFDGRKPGFVPKSRVL